MKSATQFFHAGPSTNIFLIINRCDFYDHDKWGLGKIGYFIKLIMAKHMDRAAYKFYGKELRSLLMLQWISWLSEHSNLF